jgi:hypothetical protein
MEVIFALLRYAMPKFYTRLTMNYPLSFVIQNRSLFEMEVDIIRLIPFMHELWTHLTKIQGHAKLMFQTLFGLLIRGLLLY